MGVFSNLRHLGYSWRKRILVLLLFVLLFFVMWRGEVLAAVAALSAVAAAQNPFNAVTTAGNASAQSAIQDYSGALRPQIHYSPPQHFMNDPNGAFLDANGTWHLYYQYNPYGLVAGNQHWGHATSRDLYHWNNQPIAISPETEEEAIFSGSVVIDVDNTSGFFPSQDNGVVAIYTLNTDLEQTQEVAYSHDGGYTFTKYAGNPVISIGSTQFRDPKVIRYGDHWIMSVSYSQEFVVGIFTSPDLKTWTHASNISHVGFLGLQYECPNLVKIPMDGESEDTYVLLLSIQPGAPQGGSFTQYFPGTFNGTHFTPFDSATRVLDFGKDSYAGQFFYGSEAGNGGEPVLIAWASNWQYTQQVPTGQTEGWRSSMTLPRTARLIKDAPRVGYDLITAPFQNLEPVKQGVIGQKAALANQSFDVSYADVPSGAIYFQVNVTNIPNNTFAQGTLNFTLASSSTQERISGGYFFGGDAPFWLDRSKVLGFDNPFFTDKFSAGHPLTGQLNGFMLEGVVDRSILEVFLDGGVRSAVMTFFPEGKLDTLVIGTQGLNAGVGVTAAVWALESGWS